MDFRSFLYLTLFFVVLILVLRLLNFPRKYRYHQWWSPSAAIIFSIVSLWFYLEPYSFIAEYINVLAINPFKNFASEYLPATDFPLYFNILFLLAFLLLKFSVQLLISLIVFVKWVGRKLSIWLRKIFKQQGKSPQATKQIQSLVYEYVLDRGITLKDEWVYPRRYIYALAWFAFLLLLVSLAIISLVQADVVFFESAALPVLPLLILCEIYWYLDGSSPERREERIDANETGSQMLGQCKALWQTYCEKWPDKILASSRSISSNQWTTPPPVIYPESKPTDTEIDAELNIVRKNLNQLNIEINNTQLNILKSLWEKKDVILTAPNYDEFTPLLAAIIQKNLLQRQKIIILVPDEDSTLMEGIRCWFDNSLSIPCFAAVNYKLASIDDFLQGSDILITSVQQLMHYQMDDQPAWFSHVGVILTTNISDVIYPDISSATVLFQILSDYSNDNLHFIMLNDDDRKGVESSVRNLLTARPEEYHITLRPPEDACYILWRVEGERFQNVFIKSTINTDRYLGTWPILMLPALEEKLADIRLVGMVATPCKEYIEELAKLLTQDDVTGVKNYQPLPYFVQPEERVFIIAYDRRCNLVATMVKSLSLGKSNAFIHVVSPLYLLRDYLADNLAFFLTRHSMPPGMLSPISMRDKPTVAYYLLERLLATELTEDEINRHLEYVFNDADTTAENTSTEEILDKLLYDVFKIKILQNSNLSIKTEYQFHHSSDKFIPIIKYKINRNIRDKLPEDWKKQYKIIDPDDNTLAYVLKDHLYQNYLPGQVHAFQGKPFRIVSIDHKAHRIKTEHINPDAEYYYRCLTHIESSPIRPVCFEEKSYPNGANVTLELAEADFTVSNKGYYTFFNTLGFNVAKYTNLQQQNIKRSYQQGRVLKITFTTSNDDDSQNSIKNPALIAKTLSFLINELRLSIFPETHQYLLPCVVSSANDENQEDKRLKLMPHLLWKTADDNVDSDEKQGVTLYFFEDSSLDMGMIRTIHDNWETIFCLLEDYFVWILEDEEERSTFLKFGLVKIPQWLRLQDTYDFLQSLLSYRHNRLSTDRQCWQQAPINEDNSFENKRTCDFCAEPMSSTIFERLDDGRERCSSCKNSAVDTKEKLENTYTKGRAWLLAEYGLGLRKDIDISFTDAATLQKAVGSKFIPTPDYDARTIGVASKVGENMRIIIENGQPYHMILATVVHELTHIWQFDNLDYNKMNLQQIEGHAMFTEISCLRSKGIGTAYCKQEANRQDIYGRGFREISQQVQNSGGVNPFEILKADYPIS